MAVRLITASMSASYHMLSAPRAPCPERDAEDRDDAEDQVDTARREQEADDGGEDDERHHPRLEEREVVFYARLTGGDDIALAVVNERHCPCL